MKYYLSILFGFVLLAFVSCQKMEENEKKAIRAVIEESTNAYKARDFNRLAAIYVQDESIIRLNTGKYDFSYSTGWENIGSAYQDLFETNPDPIITKYEKINYRIKVYKKSAWVVHDEIIYDSENEYQYKQIGIHLLEKKKGEWKIVYLSYADVSSYEVGTEPE
jgi:ketosteroid isomerase-like protein